MWPVSTLIKPFKRCSPLFHSIMTSLFGTTVRQWDSRRNVESQGFDQNGQRTDSPGSDETKLNEQEEKDSDGQDEYDDPEKVDRHVSNLARQFTQNSDHIHGENTFINATDEKLDPQSPNFSAKAWIQNLVAMQAQDPDRYPERTAGVLFKDLSVHGFGSPTDYQKDVANVLLELANLPRYLVGLGKQKIQILRNFDGVVKSGEMLVVLGRPGR